MDELWVVAPADDSDEAEEFCARIGARLAIIEGPSEVPAALNRLFRR